jgi:predicted nucleotidyltransferase
MVTQKQFTDFLQDIEPSASTKQECAKAHKTLRIFLKDHEEFKECHIGTFLSGSYKRDTAIRPQTIEGSTRRPDVDIIVVTNHTLDDNCCDVIDLLYAAVGDFRTEEKRKGREISIRKQARSVGITTNEVDMDVVPIMETCK